MTKLCKLERQEFPDLQNLYDVKKRERIESARRKHVSSKI